MSTAAANGSQPAAEAILAFDAPSQTTAATPPPAATSGYSLDAIAPSVCNGANAPAAWRVEAKAVPPRSKATVAQPPDRATILGKLNAAPEGDSSTFSEGCQSGTAPAPGAPASAMQVTTPTAARERWIRDG